MNKKFKIAGITTFIQLPVILWQHTLIVMYLHHLKRVIYTQPLNIEILMTMIVATFITAYFSDAINTKRWQAYWLIPLALIIAIIFDSNFIAQIMLFVTYLGLMLWLKPIIVHKVEAYYKDGSVKEGVYEKFRSMDVAKNHIQNKLDTVLLKWTQEVKDSHELKQMFMQSDNDYRIYKEGGDTLLFSSLWYVEKNAEKFIHLNADIQSIRDDGYKPINNFNDLLKRGNLPDDDRDVPNYLKIKNRQYADVDFKNNTVDEILSLTSEEFNEFVSSSDSGLLLTYLSTMSTSEMERFYNYNEAVVKLDESFEAKSSREQFQTAMQKVDVSEITDEQRARATLEIPLMIGFSKNIYHAIMTFQAYIKQGYYNYNPGTNDIRFEATLSSIIYDKMSDIPHSFEQVISLFRDYCDKDNFKDSSDEERVDKNEHQAIFKHLAQRFGSLIIILNNMSLMTEEENSGTNWFVEKMVEEDLIGSSLEISVSKTKELTTDKKLIDFLALTFLGICDENEDNYLENLINVTNTLFEFYPVNREACEYTMIEMMKSVAIKKVSIENANRFIAFFETLPRFYSVLNYDKIYELKELINYTISNYNPQDNDVFEQAGVKNRIILMNYLLDVEDLYYEGLVSENKD